MGEEENKDLTLMISTDGGRTFAPCPGIGEIPILTPECTRESNLLTTLLQMGVTEDEAETIVDLVSRCNEATYHSYDVLSSYATGKVAQGVPASSVIWKLGSMLQEEK